jgi:hypothetical protein
VHTHEAWKATNPAKWEKFYNHVASGAGKEVLKGVDWSMAKLRLHHPTDPTPDQMFENLSKTYSAGSALRQPIMDDTRKHVNAMLNRTMSLLND